MTITVGTNAYDTIASTDTYWTERGNTVWGLEADADKEIYLIKATDWIERNFNFRGRKADSDQRLSWPRELAYDDDGYLVGETEAPTQVKEAMYIMADIIRDGTYDIVGITTDDSAVKRQKVDVIEVEYDTTSRLKTGPVMSHIYQLLGPVITANSLLRA